jgi:hypothetical protein
MKLSFTLTFLLLLATPAFAGPSDGGGTNLTEDQLVDFAKFNQEYGVKQYALNPEKLKLSDGSVPFKSVKPLLDRLRYFYPGIGPVLNDTFDKDWLLLDATFQARKNGEKKGISQTKDVVYVSLPWIKNAKPDVVKQALVHEAIRNLANAAIAQQETAMHKKIGDPIARIAIADAFTESLTPIVYQGLPAKQLSRTMTDAFKKLDNDTFKAMNFDEEMGGFDVVLPAPREDLYRDIPKTEIKAIVAKICPGIDAKTQDTDGLRTKIIGRLVAVKKKYHDYFHNLVSGPWFLYSDFAYVDFDPQLKALLKLLDDVDKYDDDEGAFILYRDCQGIAGAKLTILEEYKKDHGKVRDPLGDQRLEQLPADLPAPEGGDTNQKAL